MVASDVDGLIFLNLKLSEKFKDMKNIKSFNINVRKSNPPACFRFILAANGGTSTAHISRTTYWGLNLIFAGMIRFTIPSL